MFALSKLAHPKGRIMHGYQDYQVVFSLQLEAIRSLEEKAKSLRVEIERHGGDYPDAECRLGTIERILGRLYGEPTGKYVRGIEHRIDLQRE